LEKRTITLEQKEALRRKLRKKRRTIKLISLITSLVFFIAAAFLFITIYGFGFLPKKYLVAIAAVLVALSLIFFVIAILPTIRNGGKIFQSAMCVLLSVLLIAANIIVPIYEGKLAKLFVEVPTEGTMNINVYVLAENYSSNTSQKDKITSIESLAGITIGIQQSMDIEYQEWALKVINKEIKGDDVKTQPIEDIYLAVDKLYAGEITAIMLNEDYANIIADNEDYKDFNEKVVCLYTCSKQIKLEYDTTKVTDISEEPFVIGIIGQDSWESTGITQTTGYRSDVNIICAVNPKTKQIMMVTLPRDSYVPLYGNEEKKDKLTHSPMQKGVNGWIQTIENYMDVKINYYVRVNFSSVSDIVDAIGGVTVENEEKFSTLYVVHYETKINDKGKEEVTLHWDPEYTYEVGTLELDGAHALAYCRERHAFKNGDMMRNKHQAQVLKACVDKVTSVAVITKVDAILKAVQGKFETNIGIADIYNLCQMQLDDMADWSMQSYSVTGTGRYAHSYIWGSNLSMVIPDETSVAKAKSYLKALINGTEFKVEK